MTDHFDDPAFCRAYDHYVTQTAPALWELGYEAGYAGLTFDHEAEAESNSYGRGYKVGMGEAECDRLGYDPAVPRISH